MILFPAVNRISALTHHLMFSTFHEEQSLPTFPFLKREKSAMAPLNDSATILLCWGILFRWQPLNKQTLLAQLAEAQMYFVTLTTLTGKKGQMNGTDISAGMWKDNGADIPVGKWKHTIRRPGFKNKRTQKHSLPHFPDQNIATARVRKISRGSFLVACFPVPPLFFLVPSILTAKINKQINK